jgi:hypothetical protein
MNLPNLYVEQGVQHIRRIVDFFGQVDDILGHQITTAIESLVMETGSSGNPFALDFSIYESVVTDSWIKCVWEFVSTFKIDLQTHPVTPQLQRQGDSMLLPLFVQHGMRDPETLAALSRCCKFLQVLRLSDILSADGKKVHSHIFQGQLQTPHTWDKFRWPTQGPPGKADWNVWRQSLKETLGLSAQLNVSCPLGRWTTSWKSWKWYITFSGSLLRVDQHAQLQAYEIIEGTLRYYSKHSRSISLL